jgi:aerotaxis receptor
MKTNLPVTGVERGYPADANILSTTDLKGQITYVNPQFVEISGFSEEELLGKSHNIVRHPEMPPAAFADLWATIKGGRSWMGLVKNRCKNGDHYWVQAFVTPVMENGRPVEYQSVRVKPTAEQVRQAEVLYPVLMRGGNPFGFTLSLGGKLTLALAVILLAAFGIAAVAGLGGLGLAALFTGIFIAGAGAVQLLLAPLRELTARSRAIVDNPVARRIYSGRDDEVGQIGVALKALESELAATVGRIADSSRHLSQDASGLAAVVHQSSEGMRRQQSETDQVATAVNEMSASVQEVARNAQQTAEAADKARAEAASGREVVAQTTAAIDHLAKDVMKAADKIHEVDERSDEITAVIDVIRSIAEQTNLLALNAAIEAARAGEAGRGFAVVADEVRTLASRTQKSTQEINAMIERLQRGSSDAVAAMGHSRARAEETITQAGKAVASLEAITRAVTTISDMSTQIATAVEQQSAVGNEINRSITSIRHVADETAAGAAHSEQAAGSVATLAEGLQQLARQFWEKKR